MSSAASTLVKLRSYNEFSCINSLCSSLMCSCRVSPVTQTTLLTRRKYSLSDTSASVSESYTSAHHKPFIASTEISLWGKAAECVASTPPPQHTCAHTHKNNRLSFVFSCPEFWLGHQWLRRVLVVTWTRLTACEVRLTADLRGGSTAPTSTHIRSPSSPRWAGERDGDLSIFFVVTEADLTCISAAQLIFGSFSSKSGWKEQEHVKTKPVQMNVTHKMIWLKTTAVFSEIQIPVGPEKAIFLVPELWLHEASCFPSEADRLCHTWTEAHCYSSPWRCQNAGCCCCSVIYSQIVLLESAHKPATPPHRVDHPVRLFPPARASTCPWLRLGGEREGSRIQIIFNFIRMNSWHWQARAAELCDAAAAWRGWLRELQRFCCAVGAEPGIHSSTVINVISVPVGIQAVISSLHNLLEFSEMTAATLQTWAQTEESCWFENIYIDKKQQIQTALSSH